MVENCLKYTKSPFTLTCPQALIDKKGMAKIKEDFGLLPDDNIVALEVIESAILDDENHTATLTQGTRDRNGENSAIRLTFPDKITVDGEDYEVVDIAPEVFADLSGIEEIFIHAEIVPYLDPHALDDKDLSGIILYVPDDLVEEYQNTYPWSLFPDIRPISEAGIETVTVGSAPVNMKYIENRRIVIRHNGKKYSVQGTLLR